jgi:hypothetical protein
MTVLAAAPAWASTTGPAAGQVLTRVQDTRLAQDTPPAQGTSSAQDASGAQAVPAGPEPGSPTPAPGEQLILSTYNGHVYTIDPSDTDACQNQPAGLSTLAANSPITMTPDGTVWTAAWNNSSNLGKVGTFNPSSVNWANGTVADTPAAPHDIAGLLAMNATTGVATGFYSNTLMSVNFQTGVINDIGALPASPGDGLTWAPNGDLLMAGYANHIWRLPASVLQSALNGNQVRAGDWLDLGGISASVWANSKWYNPFTWGGTAQTVWWNPFTWADSSTSDHIYGLATGSDGTIYIAMKYGKLLTLAPNNLATTADSGRALQVIGLRNLTGGTCSFGGSEIDGMTSTTSTLWAPAPDDTNPSNVSGTAGQPITGTVTSSVVKAPVTVAADPATMPAGVTIGSDGTVSGTPVAAGNTTAHVKICGQDTCVWQDVNFGIAGGGTQVSTQKPPPADPTISLNGSANAPVSGSLPGATAAAPSTFTVTDPSQLPTGVSIDVNGNLMGIPTDPGTYAIPVKACNATGCTTGTVTLTIGPDESPCDQNPASTVALVTAHTRMTL